MFRVVVVSPILVLMDRVHVQRADSKGSVQQGWPDVALLFKNLKLRCHIHRQESIWAPAAGEVVYIPLRLVTNLDPGHRKLLCTGVEVYKRFTTSLRNLEAWNDPEADPKP